MVDLDPQGKQFQVGCIQSYARILDLNFPPFNLFFLFAFQVFFFTISSNAMGFTTMKTHHLGRNMFVISSNNRASKSFFWGGTLRVKDEEDAQPEGKTPQPQQ